MIWKSLEYVLSLPTTVMSFTDSISTRPHPKHTQCKTLVQAPTITKPTTSTAKLVSVPEELLLLMPPPPRTHRPTMPITISTLNKITDTRAIKDMITRNRILASRLSSLVLLPD